MLRSKVYNNAITGKKMCFLGFEKLLNYKQRLGLGKPAYLVACLAGPSGNRRKR